VSDRARKPASGSEAAGLPMQEVRGICCGWAKASGGYARPEERMAFFTTALPALLAREDLLAGVLRGMLGGQAHPGFRQATIFENEFLLHQDPGGRFSLRLYLYGPAEHTFVHDHTAWGISGSARGGMEILRYRRKDEGGGSGRVHLALDAGRILRPGEIETTLPGDLGIHRTGNPGAGTTWMLSVYGPPARGGVMHRFDLESGRVQPVFPPRVRKRMLAEQALREPAAAPIDSRANLPPPVSALPSR
jgi:predicted metal-dependent enzyme (double-stranded beta helix superfamily)